MATQNSLNHGHAINSHLEFLQTTSSKPFVLLGKTLIIGISQLSQMLKSLHSDTNDGHALSSLHGILQTTTTKLNALLRLRIAKIFPFRYQRCPLTKQPLGILQTTASNPYFLLSRKLMGGGTYFTGCSKAVLLLWIFYVFVLSCVCYVFVRVCLYVLCGHLLGKG